MPRTHLSNPNTHYPPPPVPLSLSLEIRFPSPMCSVHVIHARSQPKLMYSDHYDDYAHITTAAQQLSSSSTTTTTTAQQLSDTKTNYYGNYFERLFLSLAGISDAKKKTHPPWDQKSSLFLGSEIIEPRNQRI